MAERTPGSSIYAARYTTSTGGIFSQTLVDSPDNPQNLNKAEADFLGKRQLFGGESVEFYAENIPSDELPQINVVESFHLPNDDIGRWGC